MLKQPNSWTCLPASFAFVIGYDLDKFLKKLGHDGSEISFPGLSDPFCRRSFHIQECISTIWWLGYSATPFEFQPKLSAYGSNTIVTLENDFNIKTCNGVLISNRHACAWKNNIVHDPSGKTYGFEDCDKNKFFPYMVYVISSHIE